VAVPLEYLPPDHPAYVDLENLWARDILDSLDLASRPWSRHEIASALVRASKACLSCRNDPVFRRMLREFALEATRLDEGTPFRETPPRLKFEGPESTVRILPGAGFSASGGGFDDLGFDPGSGGFVQFEVMMEPRLYATTEIRVQRVRPDRLVEDTLIKNENLLVDTDESYFSLSTRYVEVLLGYTKTRWGPGRSGTLLLSDIAPAYGVLRVAGSVGGRLKLTALSAPLSQPDNHYLAAHRVTWRVTPDLSIGFSEAVRYDSEAPGFLYLVNLIPYTIVHKIQAMDGDREETIEIRNNVMVGGDLDWRIRTGWRMYAEVLIDDLAFETAKMPNRMAGQIGLHHARTVRGHPASVLLELTKVLRYVYATYYDRDFLLSGDPLGYVAGPDTERLRAEARADPAVDWSATLTLDWTRRGRGFLGEAWSPEVPVDPWSTLDLDEPVEHVVTVLATAEWVPRDTIRASSGVGYRWSRNARGVPEDDDGTVVVETSFFWRF
jgi:hypothetical protein